MNKHKVLLYLILSSLFVISVACDNEEELTEPLGTVRYQEQIFELFSVTRDIVYGQNTTQAGQEQDLLADVYQGEGDTATQRPLIIWVHGGGFVGGDKGAMEEFAVYFARSGYVSTSISYRLIDLERTPDRLRQGIVEAVYDLRAAIRHFRKEAEQYGIDPNQIFVGGSSAGGFTVLHHAFWNQAEETQLLHDDALASYVETHGGLEGDSGNPGFSSEVTGILNISGALLSLDLVDGSESAILSIHGPDDVVVPYLVGESDESGVITYGSGLIHPRADSLGMSHRLISVDNGGHDPLEECEDCIQDIRGFVYERL